jgi:hypothetical protein
VSTSNLHNEWLKATKRWQMLTALTDRDLSLKPWAEAADVDVKTLLKHRDCLVDEGAVEAYVSQDDGITYYHLKSGATLARGSAASPSEPEYVVRQTRVPEARAVKFAAKHPTDGRVIKSILVVGRPYWRVYGDEMLEQFRREKGWPTLTRQETDEWLAKIGETAEFTLGPPQDSKIPSPGLKRRA